MWVCGSYDPPGQLVPPLQQPISKVPSGPPALLTTGGVNSGPILYFEMIAIPCAFNSGVKSIRSSTEKPLRPYAGGLLGIGCVGEYHSPGTSPFGTGVSTIGQIGSPVTRLKT